MKEMNATLNRHDDNESPLEPISPKPRTDGQMDKTDFQKRKDETFGIFYGGERQF